MGNQQSTVLPPQSAGKMELTVNNVCDVLKTVGFSAGDWKELASRLEPKPGNIDTGAIQITHQGDAYKCLREVIKIWLNKDQGRSWTKLAEAVRKMHRYGDVTADNIIAQSGSNLPQQQEVKPHTDGQQTQIGNVSDIEAHQTGKIMSLTTETKMETRRVNVHSSQQLSSPETGAEIIESAPPEKGTKVDSTQPKQGPEWGNVPVASQSMDQSMAMPKKLIQVHKTGGPPPKSPVPDGGPEMAEADGPSDAQGREMAQVHFPSETAQSKELDLSTLFNIPLSQRILNEDDLSVLTTILHHIAYKWRQIGLQLKLGRELGNIEHSPLLIPGGPPAFLCEMLTVWLRRASPQPTLSALSEALRSRIVGEESLANELEKEYVEPKMKLPVNVCDVKRVEVHGYGDVTADNIIAQSGSNPPQQQEVKSHTDRQETQIGTSNVSDVEAHQIDAPIMSLATEIKMEARLVSIHSSHSPETGVEIIESAPPEKKTNVASTQPKQVPEWQNAPVTSQSEQSMPIPEKLIQEVKTGGPPPKSSVPEGVPEMTEAGCSFDTRGREMARHFPSEAAQSKELDLSTLFSESTEIEAIYGRLMMIGHAGAGKTSLQLALMNKQLPPNLSSTPLATAKSVKCQWTYAGEEAGQHWNEMTEDDEVLELAAFLSKSVSPEAFPQLIASLRNYTKDVATTAQVTPVRKGVPTINHTMVQQVLKKLMKEVLHKLTNESPAQPANTKASKSDVLLHLWDSGGQRVFLDILPAFLTSRTIFTLVFDASRDLGAKLQLPCQQEGNIIHTEDYHLSSVQLLLQWMASIHTQLRLRKPDGTPIYSPYPRILLVGTHRDELEKRSPSASEEVRPYLHSQYKGKAYAEMLMPGNPFFLVDNTTAGRGEFEDPALKQIREHVHTFSSEHFVVEKVPASWAFFRKVLQRVSREFNKPVMTYEEVVTVARACSIKPEDVPHVLSFYHELGVLLYYVRIAGHRKKWVITDPQWLIRELAKVLSPTAIALQDHSSEDRWELLCTRGILVEDLYQEVWSKSGVEPQELANLLQHFYLAAEVSNLPHIAKRHYKGKKYFVPCMLDAPSRSNSPKEEPVQRETTLQPEAPPESTSKEEPIEGEAATQPPIQISKPDPIHLVFDTEYVPPGYYIRLLASIAKVPDCKILLQHKQLNRYKVTFAYEVNNEVTVTECPQSIVIEAVTALNTPPPPSICSEIFQSLSASISEVAEWFPSVEVLFAFNCKNLSCASKRAEPHFVAIDEATIKQRSIFRCQNEEVCNLTPEQLHWFEHFQPQAMYAMMRSPQGSSPAATNRDLTLSSLIASLTSDVQDKWYSFGEALGVDKHTLDVIKTDSSDDTRNALRRMLSSWMRAHENPTWKVVAQALKCIGEHALATELHFYGEYTSSSGNCHGLLRAVEIIHYYSPYLLEHVLFELHFGYGASYCGDLWHHHHQDYLRHHRHLCHHRHHHCSNCADIVNHLARSGVSVNHLVKALERIGMDEVAYEIVQALID